jgi:pyrroloquinoline quinone biosynthesis protein D
MDENSIPAFTRGTRLRQDDARGQWVLLAPERAFVPDEIAVEILRLVDGATRLGTIIDRLAGRFEASRDIVSQDVLELVNGLAAKGLLRG